MLRVKRNVKQKVKSNADFDSVPGGIRTHGPLLRRQLLYPLSYRDSFAPALRHFSTSLEDLTSEVSRPLLAQLIGGQSLL